MSMNTHDVLLDWWRLDLRMPRDAARIEQLIGVNPTDYNWCGYTQQAAYRIAGLNSGISLASVGKCRCAARYQDAGVTRLWCVEKYRNPNWVAQKVKDFHTAWGKLRMYVQWKDVLPSKKLSAKYIPWPGDLILHESKPGSYNGHVMGCDSCANGTITVIGGNQRGVGPTGEKFVGVTKKTLALSDPYLSCVVVLSELDFLGPDTLRLCTSQAEAEALAKQLNGK